MRKTQLNKTQKTAVVGGTVLALAVGGVAFASWSSNGSGSAEVKAGTSTGLIIESDQVDGLFPTQSVAQTLTLHNPNTYAVTVSDLVQSGDATSDKGDCNATAVTAAELHNLNVLVPAGGTNTQEVQISMSNAANDECQGATFTLNYVSTGESSN